MQAGSKPVMNCLYGNREQQRSRHSTLLGRGFQHCDCSGTRVRGRRAAVSMFVSQEFVLQMLLKTESLCGGGREETGRKLSSFDQVLSMALTITGVSSRPLAEATEN